MRFGKLSLSIFPYSTGNGEAPNQYFELFPIPWAENFYQASLAALTIATMPALSALGNFAHALTTTSKSASFKYAPHSAPLKSEACVFLDESFTGSSPVAPTSLFCVASHSFAFARKSPS